MLMQGSILAPISLPSPRRQPDRCSLSHEEPSISNGLNQIFAPGAVQNFREYYVDPVAE